MFWLVLITLIICLTILCAIYIFYCNENGVDLLPDNSEYAKRLEALEKKIKELESK